MPRFRATVWTLSAAAGAVEGDAGIQRHIAEEFCYAESGFKAWVMDNYTHHVDDQVWIGPISAKPDLPLLGR